MSSPTSDSPSLTPSEDTAPITIPPVNAVAISPTNQPAIISMALNPSPLERLPQEIFLHINKLLIFRHASRLARTSKFVYRILNKELYKLAGKHDHWYPLYVAAATSNIATFERCLEFGAVIDSHWPLNSTLTFGHGQRLFLSLGWRPLRQAISSRQVEAVKWLLRHGADPDETFAEAVLLGLREAPLALAFRRGYGSLENVTPSRSILFALLEAGAGLDYIDEGPAEEIEAMYNDSSYISLYWWI
ncbi:Ankyrin repeat [Fusarium oxysporum f. sp. vasinfectum]|uniref:Uncharacterized protein n=1 Tax=Fusarium oxysporum f. sp. vasinfectum 25433 TaxID=1089449 RepID=X0M6A1_FUSOX|nr:hypothetical protein FOTG_05155 [Fusarium oxysporum f. sp. vasinfectum 25433]KAK2682252.1 Ankyrin repeat [Fusarium oxysporum f. sp. vasinfectum]KAK2938478.1 Ankyrin repeat [Fusarium oxysporum f. sp. vasinfectum]